MPYVTTVSMLDKARKEGDAIGAFNVENLEMIQAVIQAAEEARAPVILQTTPSTVTFAGVIAISAAVKALAENSCADIALHLDHGTDYELCMRALEAGYSSIMIDGSRLTYDENVTITRKVVEACDFRGIPVEAELGAVGGKEDDLEGHSGGHTVPEEAMDFIKQTNCASLAIGIGTAHGVYDGEPILDKMRLSAIAALVDVPLVLHGASGLSDTDITDCIKRGISKINYATELRIAYSNGVRDALTKDPKAFDPKIYVGRGRENVKQLVAKKIKLITLTPSTRGGQSF